MAATTSSCSQTIGMVGDEEMGLVCRICQEAINRAKDIFAEQEPGKLIYEIIDDICRLGIFPGDGLSRHICTSCYQSTLQFYRFKRSAQEGKSALECIQKFSDPCHMGVKQEPDEAVTVEGEALVRERRKNTNSLCRLCANVSRFYRNIFMQKHHGIPFYQILNELFCLNVAPGDDFPAWVCQTCHLNVIEFFKFKRLAHYKSSSLPRPSPDVGMVVTKPLVKVRSQESLLERKERQESDRSQRKVPTPVSSPAVDSDSSSPSTSQSTSPGARLYSTAGTGVYTSAFGGSVDDVEDINDYLEWQEYVEFTDFIDSFPLPNSADDTYFESQMLDGMREALSMARMPPGASRRATLNHQQTMRERLQALRSSQANRKRLHELRMMKLKAEIGLKEQKVRHMRNMMAVRKKIMESKEEIRKIKAKTQQLNEWRKLIEEGGSTSNPEGDAVSSLSSLAAEGESVLGSLENVVIKEEPRDYSAMTEVHIKEEPESDTDEVIPGNGVSESLVVNVFPKIEMSPDGEEGETDGSASNQGTEGVGTSSVNEEAVDNSRKRPGCVVGAKDVSASGPKVLRLGYSTETLRHAVESVASHRWSIRKAASHYKIPWGVLRDYVKISQESGYISSLPSRETAGESSLSAENEERLAKFVSEMEQRGFRMSRDMVEQVANAFLEEEPSAPCISGSWLDEFCTRHSSNLCSKPDSKRLPPGHKESTLLCDFYDVIKLLHERLGIVVTPDQVWNCDETLLCCMKKDNSVVSKVGRRREFENSGGSEVLANTVLCSGNASGAVGPTMVVLKHASKDSNLLCSKVMVASSKTGSLDFKLFKRWFTEFIRDVKVEKPLLLLIDAQNNHLSPEVIDLAVENSVIFIPIYFNDSGSPQPIQASVLHSLQESWISYIEKFQRNVSTVVPRTADFLSWFPSALKAADVEDSIIAGFCRAAVYPPHRWVLEKPETSGCEVGGGRDATPTKFEGTSFKQCLKELIKGLYTKKQSSDSTR